MDAHDAAKGGRRVLVVLAHPDLRSSRVNARWLAEAAGEPGVEVRDLYAAYPDGAVDAAAEQALLERADAVVFQVPVYWYSCPALLRTWFDTVYEAGWAYGAEPGRLAGKRFAAAVSAGDVEDSYRPGGRVGLSMGQVLAPFEATCNYVGGTWAGHFSVFGAEVDLTDERLDESARGYARWLRGL